MSGIVLASAGLVLRSLFTVTYSGGEKIVIFEPLLALASSCPLAVISTAL
jgi:hypothetical protein